MTSVPDTWEVLNIYLAYPLQTNVTLSPDIVFEEHFFFHVFSLTFSPRELESSACE